MQQGLAQAGIGLRAPHYAEVLAQRTPLAWVEVHSENFFIAGGAPLRLLDTIAERYPVSLHGVGLSLGSADTLNLSHLKHLETLATRVKPIAISEHLCWSSIGGRYLNDLLPLPYSEEALQTVCANIRQAQDILGRRILIENVSSYIRFTDPNGTMLSEWDFLAEVAARSDCGILLDVNNIYVSSINHGFDPAVYLDAMPADRIGEIHLAGHESDDDFLIDTHSRPVADAVWTLYADALQRFGARPTLIEWDSDIPELGVLLGEASKAQALIDANEHLHVLAA